MKILVSNTDEKEEYVLLSKEDYIKLETIRRNSQFYSKVDTKMIDFNMLYFLSSVLNLLEVKDVVEFSIIQDTVTINVRCKEGNQIYAKIDTKLIPQYYGKPLKFIADVL